MIARRHRFRGHNSVARVRGRAIRTPLLHVYYAHNPKRRHYRMAVVVSKKTEKTAVKRNRIRRRLYECVRSTNALEGLAVDAVFVVRDGSLATIDASELQKLVLGMCEKIASQTRK